MVFPIRSGANLVLEQTLATGRNRSVSDKTPPRFRKTKSDKWAVMAPVEDLERALAGDGKIDVQKRSGDWSTFKVASLGKPFDVDGVQMCYGYGPDDNDDADNQDDGTSGASGSTGDPQAGSGSRRSSNGARSGRPGRSRSVAAPSVDGSEPLPEYQGGPEDEWDGGF